MADPLRDALDPEDANAFDPSASLPSQEPASASQPAAVPVAAAPVVGEPAAADSRPRNPDGTYKKTSALSPSLRARARDLLGLEDADLDDMAPGTVQNLIIGAQDRLYQESQQWARRAVVADGSPRHVPEPEPDTLDLGTDENGQPVKEEDLNPALVRFLKNQQKKIRELEGSHKQVVERDQQRATVSHRQAVDEGFEALVEKLGEQGALLYGKGGLAERQPTSPENLRRHAVYGTAGIDRENDSERVIAKKLAAAHALLHPEAPRPATPQGQDYGDQPPAAPAAPAAAPKNGKPTVNDWNDGAVARPTNRQQQELPAGRERAIKNLARRRAEQRGGADTAEIEGLPE